MYNLETLIKAILSKKPMTGYDISKRIYATTGNSHQQIYRALNKLLVQGELTCKLIPQEGKPDKKVYTFIGNSSSLVQKTKATDFTKTSMAYELATRDVINGTSTCGEYLSAMREAEQKVLAKLLPEGN